MDRTHGRAASGERVDGPVPHGHWKVVTLTAAVRLGGVPEPACLAFDGATDTACFETYVGRCLAPTLRPGDIVVMDNLACHKTAEVARLIARGRGRGPLPAGVQPGPQPDRAALQQAQGVPAVGGGADGRRPDRGDGRRPAGDPARRHPRLVRP